MSMKTHLGTTYSDVIILVSYMNFGKIQRLQEAKMTIFHEHILICALLSSEPKRISTQPLYSHKVRSLRYISAAGSMGLSSFKF